MALRQIRHKPLLMIATTVGELNIRIFVFRRAKIVLSCLVVCIQMRNKESEKEHICT